MGYYSNLAIEGTYHEDHSYPSPELQLKWRIEDLRSRLEDISTGNYGITAHCFMGCRFSRDNLVAYTPPEYFSRKAKQTQRSIQGNLLFGTFLMPRPSYLLRIQKN